jgi:HindVP restriction endonuclease
MSNDRLKTPAQQTPGLFGIKHSNRDFTQRNNWGKNKFNSSFPASLSAFLENEGFENIYLKLAQDMRVYHDSISTTKLYGMNPLAEDIFYAFESVYTPFQQLVIGQFPRIDLVNVSSG